MGTFQRLGYPDGLLQGLKKKAENIWRRDCPREREEKQCIVVPYSKKAEPVTKFLTRIGVNVIHSSGRKIRDCLRNTAREDRMDDNRVVYRIPCGGCEKSYYGETSRGLHRRLKEHKDDLRHNRDSNSLVVHAVGYGHLPAWNNTTTLHSGLERRKRRTVEAAYITTEAATNHREGFVKLAASAARMVVQAAVRRHRVDQSAGSTYRRPAG